MARQNAWVGGATRPLAGGLLCAAWLLAGCRTDAPGADDSSSRPGQQEAPEVAAFQLKPDSGDLLLTWISDDGDFHTAERIDEVPQDRRSQVRVVKTKPLMGTGKTVFVADLTHTQADGSYPVKSMTRAQWDALGADRRSARLEELAPKPDEPKPLDDEDAQAGELRAVIYGADWCKPCHDAEAYLKSLGVNVTKKNIEKSRAAQAEMQEKLRKVQRSGAGIPVIDLMGQLFVGFSKPTLQRAVSHAKAQLESRG